MGINEVAPEGDEIPGGVYYKEGISLDIKSAQIKIGDQIEEVQIGEEDTEAKLVMHLDEGKYMVNSKFLLGDGTEKSVYYAYLKLAK